MLESYRKSILALTIFTTIVLNTQAQDIITGLQGHWTFDGGTATDVVNSYNGTVYGAVPGSDEEGKYDGALYFDGVDDYVDLSAHENSFKSFTEGTISLRFKAPSGNRFGTLFGFGQDASNYMMLFHGGNFSSSPIDNECLAYINTQSGSTSPFGYSDRGSYYYNDNAWHHIVLVVSATQNKVYIDGNPEPLKYHQGTANSGGNLLGPTLSKMFIGKRGLPGSGDPFKGLIDDVRIYNRPLSENDVETLYNTPVSGSGLSQQSPVGHWSFEGNVQDVSGNNYHGVLNGTSSYVQGVDGVENSAIYLDGQSNYIDLSAHTSYFTTLAKGSVSLWFKVSANESGTLLGLGNNNDNNLGLFVGGNISTGVESESVAAYREENGSISYGVYSKEQIGGFYYNDDQWHHLAFTVSKDANLVYVDGNKIAVEYLNGDENVGVAFMNLVTTQMALGGRFYSTDPFYFTGALDDFRIYNRALSGAEVSAIYNEVKACEGENQCVENLYADKLGINTKYVPADYHLAVKGKIITEGVKVLLCENWPDYVFEPDYKLTPLEETKAYIQENKHLPNIPSAATMSKEGMDVQEMNAKLLEKVEELTLYLIEQNEQIKQLQKTVNELKSNSE